MQTRRRYKRATISNKVLLVCYSPDSPQSPITFSNHTQVFNPEFCTQKQEAQERVTQMVGPGPACHKFLPVVIRRNYADDPAVANYAEPTYETSTTTERTVDQSSRSYRAASYPYAESSSAAAARSKSELS